MGSLAPGSDNNGKIHQSRWDIANLLNGERLVADDITSHHYRAIDRKILMEKVVEWFGVCHLSSACNDAAIQWQHLFALLHLTIEASALPSEEVRC